MTAAIALMPLNLTWEALLSLDTRLFELGAIFSEVAFMAWIWCGSGHPHPVVLKTMPAWAWTILVLPLAIGHVNAFARRNRDTRAIALIIDASGYLWLLLNVLRGRFHFAEVFLWAFLAMGVVAVFSLHRRKGTADGNE